jgi:hypothetical protein
MIYTYVPSCGGQGLQIMKWLRGAMNMASVGGLPPPMLTDHEGGGFIWEFTVDNTSMLG